MPRTYQFEFDPTRGAMIVFACYRHRVEVAEVLGPYGINPALRVQHPLGVHALAEICRLIQSRQHLAGHGLPAAGGRGGR